MTDRHDLTSPDRLLAPDEASSKLGVSPRTLLRYEVRGWITPQRTPGGHRRYIEADVERLRVDGPPGADAPAAASG